MSVKEANRIVGEFLMEKRKLDSEVYEAIRVQYINSTAPSKENAA